MKIVPTQTSQTAYHYTSHPSQPAGREKNSPVPEEGTQGNEKRTKGQETSKADIYSGASKGVRSQNELSRQELQELLQLKKRDQEVRQHEMAHIAAGGPYVRGGARFEYVIGPDGRRYAVGGEVSIDTSPEKDPRATLQKMRVVQQAALAPANPSAQDRRVAAQAAARAMQAMMEILKEEQTVKMRSILQEVESGRAGKDGAGNPKNLIDIYI